MWRRTKSILKDSNKLTHVEKTKELFEIFFADFFNCLSGMIDHNGMSVILHQMGW